MLPSPRRAALRRKRLLQSSRTILQQSNTSLVHELCLTTSMSVQCNNLRPSRIFYRPLHAMLLLSITYQSPKLACPILPRHHLQPSYLPRLHPNIVVELLYTYTVRHLRLHHFRHLLCNVPPTSILLQLPLVLYQMLLRALLKSPLTIYEHTSLPLQLTMSRIPFLVLLPLVVIVLPNFLLMFTILPCRMMICKSMYSK